MTKRLEALLLWSSRVLGIVVCLFLSLFALDAFSGGKSAAESVGDFLIHVAPMLVLLGVIALSWRREWVGGVVFIAVAFAYAYVARHHVSWIATVSGPLLAVGILFLWSWTQHRRSHRTS
jgi:hypothetical protein